MGIALQRVAILSERRVERLVNSELNECELPMFLSGKGGVLNGYMIP
jgi:histidine ammonia-lyase